MLTSAACAHFGEQKIYGFVHLCFAYLNFGIHPVCGNNIIKAGFQQYIEIVLSEQNFIGVLLNYTKSQKIKRPKKFINL